MKKIIYTLFLLPMLIVCVCLCGCGESTRAKILQPNSFRILRQINFDGSIVLSYIFPLNSNWLRENGFDKDEIEVLRFYLTTYVNALASNNEQRAENDVEIKKGLYFKDVDGVGFSLRFEDLRAQNEFFGVANSGQENQNKIKKTGLFLQKQTIKTTFPISSSKIAGDLKLVCVMAISSWCNDCNISEEEKEIALAILQESCYIYDFSNWQRGLKSELMYQDEAGYHNVFIKSVKEIESSNEIMFWQVQPNRPAWYLSALIVVVCAIVVAFLIQKKKKSKINQKIFL